MEELVLCVDGAGVMWYYSGNTPIRERWYTIYCLVRYLV